MHKRKKLFPRGCGLFCCVCLWRRQFHTKKQGHKDICGQFFFHDTQRKQVLYFSINWNTCPISMCYKDKSFTGERSKASNYKLFSLKKKISSVHLLSSELGSAFCSKRTDSALLQPSECFTGVVTTLCAVSSEEDHDTWTRCHHLKPTWVVGLPLCVKWKIYSLAKSFICLNAIQTAWVSSKCLPSAFDLTRAGFQGRYIPLFCLITSSQRYLAALSLLCLIFISDTSRIPTFLSFISSEQPPPL